MLNAVGIEYYEVMIVTKKKKRSGLYCIAFFCVL